MGPPVSNAPFDFAGRISEKDQDIAASIIGSLYRPPDLVIAPAGHGEYLFRWWVLPHNLRANVYFHIQTASDPERPLHDHPWDSTSVILAGGYEEIVDMEPDSEWAAHPVEQRRNGVSFTTMRKPGDVVHRPATWAHRLILPPSIPYSMSLFSTGPKVKQWGFYLDHGFVPYNEVTHTENGLSHWKKELVS